VTLAPTVPIIGDTADVVDGGLCRISNETPPAFVFLHHRDLKLRLDSDAALHEGVQSN
jgi:hypothetical protein